MAKKSNLLIKVAVLIALAAAVFFGLDSLRKQAGSDRDVAKPGTAGPTLSREEAERIGTEIGTRIGTEIGTQIGREVAAQMLAERQSELQLAEAPGSMPESTPAPAPEPVPEPAPEPVEEDIPAAAEPGPEPAMPAEDTFEPAAEVAASPETGAAAEPEKGPGYNLGEGDIPGTPVAQPVSGDPWWTATLTGEAGTLAITYAGSYKSIGGGESGIALMFTGRFNKQTDFSAISVPGIEASSWRLGVSPGLIYAPASPGNYTVTVNPGLTDVDGNTLKSAASGPVSVD